MRTIHLFSLLAAGMLALVPNTFAAEAADAKAELQTLITKVKEKLNQGKRTEKDLADELKEFDKLLESHKSEKTDDVAQILFMKATLYGQVFENSDRAKELLKQLKTDFPDTQPGKRVDAMLESMQKQEEAQKVAAGLVVGAPFPDFDEKDLDGKPLSIAKYKGKVVLLDFWATWCGPCVQELPNVLKTYEKHHADGFEIIGISLDKDEKALREFIKTKKMPWPQYFDGKGWESKLGQKYGVMSIPATYLLDAEGKIAAKSLRGEALEAEVSKLLKK